jgi:hypothetical protein
VQSGMRYGKFANMEVLGSEFRDNRGVHFWAFAFWSESYPCVRTCFVSRGDFPEHITLSNLENPRRAQNTWEAWPEMLPS